LTSSRAPDGESKGENLKKPEIARHASSAAEQPAGEVNECRIGEVAANVLQLENTKPSTEMLHRCRIGFRRHV